MNQEWPTPLHYVVTDPKTRRLVALSEVERHQEHVEKMRGAPLGLRDLVEQCLDNDPSRRPPISNVSERMRRMKEAENVRSPDAIMNQISSRQISYLPLFTVQSYSVLLIGIS